MVITSVLYELQRVSTTRFEGLDELYRLGYGYKSFYIKRGCGFIYMYAYMYAYMYVRITTTLGTV